MTQTDLPAVERVAGLVHPDYPEALEILAERQRLYPPGCFVLGRPVQCYALAHPWRLGHPPKLDTRLHRLPDDADTFYIHDVAILPGARGAGKGEAIFALLLARAIEAQLGSLSLIAVGQSLPFWTRCGFAAVPSQALASYGGEARFMVRTLPR